MTDYKAYSRNYQIIIFKLLKKELKISNLKLSELIKVPYTTFLRACNSNFLNHQYILKKIVDYFDIEYYFEVEEINKLVDECILNYLYDEEINIIQRKNNIFILGHYISRLLKSDFNDLEAFEMLGSIKEYLFGVDLYFYNLMDSILNNKKIEFSNIKYIEAISYYKLANSLLEKNKLYEYYLLKERLTCLFTEVLALDKLFEIRLLETFLLVIKGVLSVDELKVFRSNKKLINEVLLIEALYYLSRGNIRECLMTVINVDRIDKQIILKYIEKNNKYYVKDLLKNTENLLKSRVYEFIKSVIKLF